MKKIINKIREYFRSKNAEQIFTLSLLMGCVGVMMFCAIVRLCGGLWFTADLESVPVPSEFWQTIIMNLLYIFEATFVYKILCHAKWSVCVIISTIQAVIVEFIPSNLAVNIINLVAYFAVPLCFRRNVRSLLDSAILYAVSLLYSVLFLVGRIGSIEADAGYNFVYNVLGSIDYKIWYVVVYLIQKYCGGIILWKKQKRPILAP